MPALKGATVEYQNALVTGGAGFIGSLLSKRLLEMGLKVTILDDLSTGKRTNVPRGAVFVEGSTLDSALVTDVVRKGIDIVHHLAARVSIRSSLENFYADAETNMMGTVSLLDCLKKSDVTKLVYASSMAVYADSPTPAPINEEYTKEPISPYGISKLASEKYCLLIGEALGIKTVILRYFNTYGAGQTFTPYVGVITIFINRLLDGKPPVIFGSGYQRRDFVHVSSVTEATLKAMNYAGDSGIFNVGTGVGTSVNEIASLLCDKINPRVNPVHDKEQTGELKNSVADISKARELLGYQPHVKLENKIDEVIDWNRRNLDPIG